MQCRVLSGLSWPAAAPGSLLKVQISGPPPPKSEALGEASICILWALRGADLVQVFKPHS